MKSIRTRLFTHRRLSSLSIKFTRPTLTFQLNSMCSEMSYFTINIFVHSRVSLQSKLCLRNVYKTIPFYDSFSSSCKVSWSGRLWETLSGNRWFLEVPSGRILWYVGKMTLLFWTLNCRPLPSSSFPTFRREGLLTCLFVLYLFFFFFIGFYVNKFRFWLVSPLMSLLLQILEILHNYTSLVFIPKLYILKVFYSRG